MFLSLSNNSNVSLKFQGGDAMYHETQEDNDSIPFYDMALIKDSEKFAFQKTRIKENLLMKNQKFADMPIRVALPGNEKLQNFVLKSILTRYKGCVTFKKSRLSLNKKCVIKKQKDSLNKFVRNMNEYQFKYMSYLSGK